MIPHVQVKLSTLFSATFYFTAAYFIHEILSPMGFSVESKPAFIAFFLGTYAAALFFHELGHVLAGRYFGMRLKRVQIMATGAAVYLTPKNGSKKTPFQQLLVSLSGPMLGLLFSATLIFLTEWLPLSVTIVAWLTVFENLLNLLPIRGFDGHRIVKSISSIVLRWVSRTIAATTP